MAHVVHWTDVAVFRGPLMSWESHADSDVVTLCTPSLDVDHTTGLIRGSHNDGS